jgi:transposase
MLSLTDGIKVFVSLSPVDMRKSINGLSALILDVFTKSPQSRHIFLFYNKSKDKVKLIFWDRNGFVLYYKRLEKSRFKFNKSSDNQTIEISHNQLQWLLAGLDFQLMNEFNNLNYSEYY